MPPRPLRPFSDAPELAALHLSCDADWQDGTLTLQYSLEGPLEPIQLPEAEASRPPQRSDGLWETTCFEAFLGLPGQRNYWEFNLAANGDWNVYALNDYRSGLQPELALRQLPFTVARQRSGANTPATQERFDLQLKVDLRALISPEAALELSAAAVLEHRQLGCSYWAWRHCGPEPDFHRRDSFVTL